MRIPKKGSPDFTSLSDARVKECLDLAQQMIFAYQYCDEEKVRVLTEVWKQLSDEHTDRLSKAPVVSEECPTSTVHKIKMVKPVKRVKL